MRVAGRDATQLKSRVALRYPFPLALVALTLTCAPSDRAPWISAKFISLFRRNSPISLLPAHTSCDVSLFGAEVHLKNRLLVRPSGRTSAEDRLTFDQPRPIVNRSRKAASATPRGAVRDQAYRGRRLERVAQAVAAPIRDSSRQSWSAHVPRPSTASKSRRGLHLMSGYWLPEEAVRAGDYR